MNSFLGGASGTPSAPSSMSVPFAYTGGPPRRNNSLSLGAINVDTRQRQNNYIGLNSFVSVAAAYVIVTDPNDSTSGRDAQNLGLSMLCFARNKDFRGQMRTANVNYNVAIGSNTVEVKELTQLNDYLQKCKQNYASASEVLAEWSLLGVLKNETAPVTIHDYGNSARSRIVNIIASHRVAVLNYWAGCKKIVQTQKLYLIVRKNSITNRYEIVPFSDPNRDHPTIEDLMPHPKPTDGDPIELGVALYVGRSSEQSMMIQNGHGAQGNLDVSKSLVSQGLLNTIEIYLGI